MTQLEENVKINVNIVNNKVKEPYSFNDKRLVNKGVVKIPIKAGTILDDSNINDSGILKLNTFSKILGY